MTDVAAVPHRTRPLLRPCMDWTEHRHHLAGGLGAALAGGRDKPSKTGAYG